MNNDLPLLISAEMIWQDIRYSSPESQVRQDLYYLTNDGCSREQACLFMALRIWHKNHKTNDDDKYLFNENLYTEAKEISERNNYSLNQIKNLCLMIDYLEDQFDIPDEPVEDGDYLDAEDDLDRLYDSVMDDVFNYRYDSIKKYFIDYIPDLYNASKSLIFEMLDKAAAGHIDITRKHIEIKGTELSVFDLLINLIETLNDNDTSALQNAAELENFIDQNFIFPDDNKKTIEQHQIFLACFADTLNLLGKYNDCDEKLNELKLIDFSGAYYTGEEISCLLNQDDKSLRKALEIGYKAATDPVLLLSDNSSYLLRYLSLLFSKTDDTLHMLFIDNIWDLDSDSYDRDQIISVLKYSSVFESIVNEKKQPETADTVKYLNDIGFNRYETITILSHFLAPDFFLYNIRPEENRMQRLTDKIINIRKYNKDELNSVLKKINISILKALSSLIKIGADNPSDKIGTKIIENEEKVIYTCIDDLKIILAENHFIKFSHQLSKEDSSFSFIDFIKNCLHILSEITPVKRRFCQYIMGAFTFDDFNSPNIKQDEIIADIFNEGLTYFSDKDAAEWIYKQMKETLNSEE